MAKYTQKSRVVMTKGSWCGHLARRVIHISMAILPFVYYVYGERAAAFFQVKLTFILYALIGLVVLGELIRLKYGLVFFGQRAYESRQVSAFAWGLVAIILVLLFSPGPEFSFPIIWSLALVDPLLGELRGVIQARWVLWLIGSFVALIIWWGCAYWFGISLWWGVVLAPISVTVEQISFKMIDDNALMLLVPLFIVMIVRYVAAV